MFMLIICVVAYLFDFTSEISEDIFGVYIGIGCVSFALLYFTFEGIRGTFTYHELIKTNQNNNKKTETYSTLIPDIISIIVIISVGVITWAPLSKRPPRGTPEYRAYYRIKEIFGKVVVEESVYIKKWMIMIC